MALEVNLDWKQNRNNHHYKANVLSMLSTSIHVLLTCEGISLGGGELEGHLMLVSVDHQVVFCLEPLYGAKSERDQLSMLTKTLIYGMTC